MTQLIASRPKQAGQGLDADAPYVFPLLIKLPTKEQAVTLARVLAPVTVNGDMASVVKAVGEKKHLPDGLLWHSLYTERESFISQSFQ